MIRRWSVRQESDDDAALVAAAGPAAAFRTGFVIDLLAPGSLAGGRGEEPPPAPWMDIPTGRYYLVALPDEIRDTGR